MLRRAHRFHGYNALNYAYRKGVTVRSGDISLRYVRNDRQPAYRVAVVVGKKVHKSAVVRNRIRRRVYEQIRHMSEAIAEPYDLVLTVHTETVATMPADVLSAQLQQLLQRAHISAIAA